MTPGSVNQPVTELDERLEPHALLTAIVDSTTDLMWVIDAGDHRVLWSNRALREYFRAGLGIDVRPGMGIRELVPSAVHAERLRELYGRALREGRCDAEYETASSGLVLELHLSVLERQGKAFGISAFGRDVTQQRRTAEQLRRSEGFFRAIQQASPDLAAVVGADGRYKFFNAASAARLGYSADEMLAHPPFHVGHPDDVPRMSRALRRVMSTPHAVERHRYRARHRDGSWRHLELLACNELDNPDVQGVLINTRDVTDQVLLAARLEHVREEEKTRIARDLHDQLGQELTGLKIDLLWVEEQLESVAPGPAVNALVDRVVAASALSEQMIEEIQRIATDLRPAALDRLGLGVALQQEARRFEARTEIACRVELAAPLPALPESVATALYRIAHEALTNVARHAHATGVVITLALAADGVLTETIDDDGVGVDPARAADASALGLAGMRERAALEGGELGVSRRDGGGTRVQARIPLHPELEPRP